MDNKPNPNPSSDQGPAAGPRQQVVDKIKQANNILVTVSANPSIDQLAACIGLTLLVNKLGKHGTAVFSGEVPSTIEFLQPEDTLEKTTDSLRDFIIALDKSKADKLRYKVEDRVVKIFITPYRASLSDKDLDFSYGDFNVDVVLALGVQKQQDLDQAITAHGRILHDATVISVNKEPNVNLGSVNWVEESASSLSEMVAGLESDFDKKVLDGQIATAFLTGIVAETNRFSNEKTTPQTMSISAKLMSAGANQQLVVSKLEPPEPEPPAAPPAPPEPPEPPKDSPAPPQPPEPPKEEEKPKPDDGTLQISHDEKSEQQSEDQKEGLGQIEIDREGNLISAEQKANQEQNTPSVSGGSSMVAEPPKYDAALTAESEPEQEIEQTTDPLSAPTNAPLMGSQPTADANTPEPNSDLMPEQKLPDVSDTPIPSEATTDKPSLPGFKTIEPLGPPTTAPPTITPAPAQPEPAFSLPPQPPLPTVIPESRPQVAGPPSVMPGSAGQSEHLETMDMPTPGANTAMPPAPIDSGEDEKPSGSPSGHNGPPPPPVPPPPPTMPSVF